MSKFTELHSEYTELKQYINYSFPLVRWSAGVLSKFLVDVALFVWTYNGYYSPDYVGAVKALGVTQPTEETVRERMEEMKREGDVKVEFELLAAILLCYKNKRSLKGLLSRINAILVSSAMINGDFTIDEADAVTAVMDRLVDIIKEAVPDFDYSFDVTDLVTDMKFDSYIFDGDEKPSGAPSVDVQKMPAAPKPSSNAQKKPSASSVQAKEKRLGELLDELDALVGLDGIKRDVHSMINFIRVVNLRRERGMKTSAVSCNLVFTGNPGTGKTTVARIIAQLYYYMGVVKKNVFVEADRGDFVAEYQGQTAVKTKDLIKKATGGVLFIDEAYALINGDNDTYGAEAVATLLKAMEDKRDSLVVIAAGYNDPMNKFLKSNPGLSSRFNKFFDFPDYSVKELADIFALMCKSNGYIIDDKTRLALETRLVCMYAGRDETFGNARAVRNLFESAIQSQANRLAEVSDPTDSDLEILTQDDISG